MCQRAGFPLGTQGAGGKMTHLVVQSQFLQNSTDLILFKNRFYHS